MQRLALVAALSVAALAVLAGASIFKAGTTPDQLIVRYAVVPSFEKLGFYSMPRNVDEARKQSYALAQDNRATDGTEVWCRKGDFRLCVLLDAQGSLAGMQISMKVSEMEASKAPLSAANTPEWRRQQLLGEDVYSATIFFVSKEVLQSGGRPDLLTGKGLTVPNGIYLQQSDASGRETGRLHVPANETKSELGDIGFTEQACFVGMGMHWHQGLSKTSKCEEHRPYFLLYNKAHQLVGLGFSWYMKPSVAERKWFESPIPLMSKMIFPDAPACFFDWIKEYGKFSLHVYFVEKPWLIGC